MQTLVLNLTHRTDRKRAIHERLTRIGLTPVFIEAVNGHAPELADTIQPIVSRTGLNPGEVGCYLSHIKAWHHVLASEHNDALILEDDGLLDPALPQVLAALQHHADALHVVRLSALCKIVGHHIHQLTPHSSLICTTKNPSGTQGYYLTRAGAAMLLRSISDIQCAIDTEMDRYWKWGGQILTLKPSVVYQDGSSTSDIDGLVRGPSTAKPKRWLHKVGNSLTKRAVAGYMAATHPLKARSAAIKASATASPFQHELAAHAPSRLPKKQVVLFLTHQWNALVAERYRQLQTSVKDDFDVRILLDATHRHVRAQCLESLGPTAYAEQVLPFSADSIAPYLKIPMFREGRIVPGSAHFPVLAFSQFSSYEHYWVVEYDVLLQGEWLDFLRHFEACHADLICTHLSSQQKTPDWIWWHRMSIPKRYGEFVRRHNNDIPKAFFPLYRSSKKALDQVIAAHQAGLKAHCEIAIPMALWLKGMQIQDMRDVAPLYDEGSLGGPDDAPPYSTFRWRPPLSPEELSTSNKAVIYHPVK